MLQQQSIDEHLTKRLLSSATLSGLGSDEWGWQDHGREDDTSSVIDYDTQSVTSSAHSTQAYIPSRTARSSTAHTASSVAKASPRAKASTENNLVTPSRRTSGSSYPSTSSGGRTVSKGHHPARTVPESDPHAHPCETPAPACALAVYMLAHQYRLDTLEGLARKHILTFLTHSTCIPVL